MRKLCLFLIMVAYCLPGEGWAQDPALPQVSPKAVSEPLFNDRDKRLIEAERNTAALRDQLRKQSADTIANQEFATLRAELGWKEALLAREKSEYALKEYTEGIFVQDYETMKGEVALAKADLERAKEMTDYTRRREEIGEKVSELKKNVDLLEEQRAGFEVDQAETILTVLLKYTKDSETRRLTSLVDLAKAEELRKQANYDMEKLKLDRRRSQSSQLKARVPEDLVVALLEEVVDQEAKVVELARDPGLQRSDRQRSRPLRSVCRPDPSESSGDQDFGREDENELKGRHRGCRRGSPDPRSTLPVGEISSREANRAK